MKQVENLISLTHEFREQVGEKAHEIFPDLWVGNSDSCIIAHRFGFKTLSVHENLQCAEHCTRLAINTKEDRPYKVSRSALDTVTKWLTENWKDGQRILVHCQGGRERSPMSVAWAVAKRLDLPFERVYDFVLRQRPIATNRMHWIEQE